MFSLPEILLLLARADRRRALDLVATTRSRALASGAKWSEALGRQLREFLAELAAVADPAAAAAAPAPRRRSRAQLAGIFGALGIPQARA